jgi:hypothetical protein
VRATGAIEPDCLLMMYTKVVGSLLHLKAQMMSMRLHAMEFSTCTDLQLVAFFCDK